ncbi:hypothetical protein N7528_002612 [Penicillium herquei]|nr:hypothetical protein N7528_002612 [Penicillium herquei]
MVSDIFIERKWEPIDYLSLLKSLTWSWRPFNGYLTPGLDRFTGHPLVRRINNESSAPFIHLVGPVGSGKRAVLKNVASKKAQNLEDTVVFLSKSDLLSHSPLCIEILKAFAYQILWQRPSLLTQLQHHLTDSIDYEGWNEPSLRALVRSLCQGTWTENLVIFVDDISGWGESLHPLFEDVQMSRKIKTQIITTGTGLDSNEVPPSALLLNMIGGETWESEPDFISVESTAGQPAFKRLEIRMTFKEPQALHGEYLTVTLFLKHAVRLTGILTPAAVEQISNKWPMDRDQIYYDSLCSIEKSSPEISGWSFQVLSWVLNVCRPLTVQELAMAIAISQAKEDFSKDIITKNIPMQMWETCDRYLGLFLQVEGDTVYLVHETAKPSILAFAADPKRRISLFWTIRI